MKAAEKLLLEEISKNGKELRHLLRGLSIGELIALIRKQLKMSQKILAKRAKIPQSTVSNLERSKKQPNLTTLQKVLNALDCDLIFVPLLRQPIDVLLRIQARKRAEKSIRYLKGTMSLEKQEPDSRFFDEILQEEIDKLLRSNKLWEDDED